MAWTQCHLDKRSRISERLKIRPRIASTLHLYFGIIRSTVVFEFVCATSPAVRLRPRHDGAVSRGISRSDDARLAFAIQALCPHRLPTPHPCRGLEFAKGPIEPELLGPAWVQTMPQVPTEGLHPGARFHHHQHQGLPEPPLPGTPLEPLPRGRPDLGNPRLPPAGRLHGGPRQRQSPALAQVQGLYPRRPPAHHGALAGPRRLRQRRRGVGGVAGVAPAQLCEEAGRRPGAHRGPRRPPVPPAPR